MTLTPPDSVSLSLAFALTNSAAYSAVNAVAMLLAEASTTTVLAGIANPLVILRKTLTSSASVLCSMRIIFRHVPPPSPPHRDHRGEILIRKDKDRGNVQTNIMPLDFPTEDRMFLLASRAF
jgi:hypothetical protein